MDVKDHYENHLWKYYSWIYGGFEAKSSYNSDFFSLHNIKPGLNKIALDLGAGSGFQSTALAKLGFKVIAIDISAKMLEELKINCIGQDIETVQADFIELTEQGNYKPELIICMGDTLTHIESMGSVEKLIVNSFSILPGSGKFIVNFRDLTAELKDTERFIPVQSNINRIFTCFLEYFPEYVNVYDIVQEKSGDKWEQKISFYKKIRISSDKIRELFIKAGFEIEFFEINNGMITVIGKKPE